MNSPLWLFVDACVIRLGIWTWFWPGALDLVVKAEREWEDEVIAEKIARVRLPQGRAEAEKGERLGGAPGRAPQGVPGSSYDLLYVPPV